MKGSSSQTQILVCVHKPDFFLSDDVYTPIHVGKALSTIDLDMISDNTGDHISRKNRSFCELTALYWAWKNLPEEVQYVGLSHYRRYLDLTSTSSKLLRPVQAEQFKAPHIDFAKELSQYDIILSNFDHHSVSNKVHYCYHHISEDYEILRQVIADIQPDYRADFDKQMIYNNRMTVCNMFVTSRERFNDYCQWLFSILFEVERRVLLSPYPHQQRVIGFMAERLMDVYCYHHKLRVKRVPILFVSNEKDRSWVRTWFKNTKKRMQFQFSAKKRV